MQGKTVERITFTEVTQKAVKEALHHPRAISDALVESYKARRALDFLVGFGISPVLWGKMVGSRSAGQQHVADNLLSVCISWLDFESADISCHVCVGQICSAEQSSPQLLPL